MGSAKEELLRRIDRMSQEETDAFARLIVAEGLATPEEIGLDTLVDEESEADGPYPTTMEEVFAYLAAARGRLMAVVEPLSDEEIAAIGPEGWSVKDHLAHLGVWEGWADGILTGRDKAETLGVPPELLAGDGFDEMNEVIRARWADQTRVEVMTMLAANRQRLLTTLNGLSYDDLMLPYATYQPDSSDRTDPVAYWVAGNTWEHDDEHRPWIEGLVTTAGKGERGTG